MVQQEINSYSLWLFEGFTTLFFVFMAVSHQGSTTHEKERDENHLQCPFHPVQDSHRDFLVSCKYFVPLEIMPISV